MTVVEQPYDDGKKNRDRFGMRADYDLIVGTLTEPKQHKSLSLSTIQLCITALEKLEHISRYYTHNEETDIDQDVIDEWIGRAMTELLETSCASVAYCIENGDLTQEALEEFLREGGYNSGVGNPDTILPEETTAIDMLPDDYTCNNDHRYGMAVGVIQAIHDATIEVFQAIEVLTDPIELAAEIADNMPFVEVAAVGAEIALWIQETAYDLYNSAWSDTVLDELSCELFCEMAEESPCKVTFDMLWGIYTVNMPENMPSLTDDWYAWLNWFTDVMIENSSNLQIAKCGGLLGLSILRFGGGFGAMALGLRSLDTTIKLLGDDTNSDWGTLCTECPQTWEHYFDFETGDEQGWTVQAGSNAYFSAGNGWIGVKRDTGGGKWSTGYHIELTLEVQQLTKIKGHFTLDKGWYSSSPVVAALVWADPVAGSYEDWVDTALSEGAETVEHTFGEGTADNIEHWVRCSRAAEFGDHGSVTCTGITLYGNGSNPFA